MNQGKTVILFLICGSLYFYNESKNLGFMTLRSFFRALREKKPKRFLILFWNQTEFILRWIWLCSIVSYPEVLTLFMIHKWSNVFSMVCIFWSIHLLLNCYNGRFCQIIRSFSSPVDCIIQLWTFLLLLLNPLITLLVFHHILLLFRFKFHL